MPGAWHLFVVEDSYLRLSCEKTAADDEALFASTLIVEREAGTE